MPIDINELRTYKGGNPDAYRLYMSQRHKSATLVDEVLAKDEEWRNLTSETDSLRRQVNKLQKEVIAPKKKAKEPCEEEVAEMKRIQAEIKEIEAKLPLVAKERDALLGGIANVVDPEVPISDDEERDNLVVCLFPEVLESELKEYRDSEEYRKAKEEAAKMEAERISAKAAKEGEAEGAAEGTAEGAAEGPAAETAEEGEEAADDSKPLLPAPLSKLFYPLPKPPISTPLTHDDLLWRIDGYEPIRGQNVAGHRGYFLKNAGVLLNQALINYGIAFLRKRGYQVLQPPYFMKKDVMASIAQLEDFDEQLYKVSGKTDDPNESKDSKGKDGKEGDGDDGKYLIATSEQPICAYHKNEWIDPKTLPLRYAGISTCFRKEAGSSGKDIRGIFRVHQFEKIEQFCVVVDDFEESQKEQGRMIDAAKEFYESLGFPYRVVCIVSGALNDAAVKKYDLEAWFPGQNAYRELVSCSNCTDYQSRGVGARCGQKTTKNEKRTKEEMLNERASFVHFLNATLCATGRGICCLLENYQTEEGVKVPEVLVPFMGGMDFLPFVRGPMELTKGEKGQQKGQQKGN